MTKVAIDIGHANGTGSRGCGEEEHALAARLAPRLAASLKDHGIDSDIIDDPELDNAHDLTRAAARINAAGCYALGVSLHFDWDRSPNPHGAHVCYVSSRGGILAAYIANELVRILPGRSDRTVCRPGLYILKHTHPVHVLVECGFISNPHDCALAKDHPETIAAAIATGIAGYLGKYGNK